MKKNKNINIFLIHGWASSPADCWFPWLKKVLEKKGYNVIVPEMPNPKNPDIKEWVSVLKNLTKNSDLSNTYFIGHSLGCYTILRFLEELEENKKVGGVICVGGTMGRRKMTRINPKKVLAHTKNILVMFSDDDYYIPLSEKESFENELNAKTYLFKNKGHFSRKENITELPEILPLLDEIIS